MLLGTALWWLRYGPASFHNGQLYCRPLLAVIIAGWPLAVLPGCCSSFIDVDNTSLMALLLLLSSACCWVRHYGGFVMDLHPFITVSSTVDLCSLSSSLAGHSLCCLAVAHRSSMLTTRR